MTYIVVSQAEFIEHIWDNPTLYRATEDRQGNMIFYRYTDVCLDNKSCL